MNKDFLESRNFRWRFLTAIVLLLISIASFFTPDIIAFRILFAAAGIMAVLELVLAAHLRACTGELMDDRMIVLEEALVCFGTLAIVLELYPEEILLILIASIANDTFAYFAGNFLHDTIFRTRPFPKISPKKSWEGIIGGYLGSILASLLFLVIWKYAHGLHNLEYMPFSYLELIFVFFAPFFAILGDFLESLTKRLLSIKDSNEMILSAELPVLSHLEVLMKGHGGYADRIDSWVVVACFMLILKFIPTT